MPSISTHPRVLISNDLAMFAALRDRLEEHGCDVLQAAAGDRDRLRALMPNVDVVVATPRFGVDAALVGRGRRLRAVNSMVIGVDSIDVDACSAAGIIVGNGAVPENYLGMAEGTVLLILALIKDLKGKEAAMRAGAFRPAHMRARQVRGKTVGLIGLGRIGRGVVDRLQGWDVQVLAYDPYLAPGTTVPSVELVDLDVLLRRSDVVSVHVPLTPETTGLLGASKLAQMRPSAYLLNTARGGIVDEQALADALNAGRLAGAAIDAFAQEPPAPANPLYAVEPDRLILTGHCVGHGAELYPALVEAAVQNVLREMEGELPLYVVNPDVEPRWRERLAGLSRS